MYGQLVKEVILTAVVCGAIEKKNEGGWRRDEMKRSRVGQHSNLEEAVETRSIEPLFETFFNPEWCKEGE